MKHKKIILILFLVLILIGLGVFLFYNYNQYKYVKAVTYTELEEKINNQEDFVLVITQSGCSHCKQYLPELNRALKEVNFVAYELNIRKLTKEETTALTKYVSFSGTPTTVFFKEGKETTTLNRIIGYADKSKVIEKLKTLGYIK